MVGTIGMEQKGYESIRCYTYYMILSYEPMTLTGGYIYPI